MGQKDRKPNKLQKQPKGKLPKWEQDLLDFAWKKAKGTKPAKKAQTQALTLRSPDPLYYYEDGEQLEARQYTPFFTFSKLHTDVFAYPRAHPLSAALLRGFGESTWTSCKKCASAHTTLTMAASAAAHLAAAASLSGGRSTLVRQPSFARDAK
jgi:hypothetical protein